IGQVLAQAPESDIGQQKVVPLPMPNASPPPQSVQEWAAGKQQRAEVQNSISKADMARRAQKGYSQEEEAQNAPQQQQSQVMFLPEKGPAIANVESVDVGELVPVWLSIAPPQQMQIAQTAQRGQIS